MNKLKVPAIPSSFVARNMKLAEDTGSGEAKLFVGGKTREEEYDDFFSFDNGYSYYVSKQNLLEYMLQLRFEYAFHKFNDYKSATLESWDTNYKIVGELKQSECKLNLTKFIGDPKRYYICCDTAVFKNILRKITVPKLTNYVFVKDDETKSITLMLELNTDYNNNNDAPNYEEPIEYDPENEARNILFYGVPGSGKSTAIKDIIGDDEQYSERVVFHPEYTYADFIGQILPRVEDNHISYRFVPGPFTRILQSAVEDQLHKYFLVIEEINRGNAPAIFGDVFQLLDRKDGESEYGITNADIANEVYKDQKHKVKLPSNLYIYATMNTADQNVFTLDTAFKRRWLMKNVPNDWITCTIRNEKIADTNVSWEAFARKINDLITESNSENLSTEDKRLGTYFVRSYELSSREFFGEKVLMYLWNDVFRYDHSKIFKSRFKTLEELLDAFKKDGFDVFADSIQFSDNVNEAGTVDRTNDDLGDVAPRL